MKAGIDSIAFDIPQLYLPITTLAENRNIEADKLIKGLGLHKSANFEINSSTPIAVAVRAPVHSVESLRSN